MRYLTLTTALTTGLEARTRATANQEGKMALMFCPPQPPGSQPSVPEPTRLSSPSPLSLECAQGPTRALRIHRKMQWLQPS